MSQKVSFFEGVCVKEFGYAPSDIAKADGLVLNVAEEGDYLIQPVECKTRVSRNLWDEEWEVGCINVQTGKNATVTGQIRCKNYVEIDNTKTIWFMCFGTGGSFFYICQYDDNKNFLRYKALTPNSSFKFDSDVKYIRFYFISTYGDHYKYDVVICLNSNQKYEPYGNLVDLTIDNTWTPVAIEKGKTIHLTAGTHTFRLDTSLGTSARGLVVKKITT